MIFTTPTDPIEALQSRRVRSLLPTSLNSRQLQALDAQYRERAMFSARVINAEFLQRADDLIGQVIRGELTDAGAESALRDYLRSIGYAPGEDERGTITDLSSDERSKLIIRTNRQLAQEYGAWKQGQDEVVLDQYPAQELLRIEDREVPRDWPQRWKIAAREVGDNAAYRCLVDHGRMVARKDSPIWIALSRFGLPYPPFDFNSGMGVEDVDRDTAITLDIIDRDTQVAIQDRGFNDDLKMSPEVRSEALRSALVESLPGLKFTGDVLESANEAMTEEDIEAFLVAFDNAFNPNQLRWPKGDPRSQGGRFAPKNQADDVAMTTTAATGGATISVKGDMPRKGFVTATSKSTEHVVDGSLPAETIKAELKAFKERNRAELEKPGNHLGMWQSGGKIYFDVVRVFPDRETAYAVGKAAQQEGIFDLEKQETIFIKPDEPPAH